MGTLIKGIRLIFADFSFLSFSRKLKISVNQSHQSNLWPMMPK